MPNTRTHISRVEQNLHTLTAAVESCRGDLRLLSDELLTSDNSARFYFEKCLQYHHLNLSLIQERDEAAREIEGLQRNAAVTHGDLLQQNELNEILQKRVFELERSQDDHILVSVCCFSLCTANRNRRPGISKDTYLTLKQECQELVGRVLS